MPKERSTIKILSGGYCGQIDQIHRMRQGRQKHRKKAFSVVEVLLASAVFVLVVSALVGAVIYGQQTTQIAGSTARASFLAEESLEAVRNIRDADFSSLTDGQHGLAISGNQWTFSGTQDTVENFTRQVTISTVDADTKQIVTTVNWQVTPQRTGSVSMTTYLTNWLRTVPLFCGWANPVKESGLDLPGTENALKVQVQGNYAYVVRDGGTSDFVVVDITNTASPSVLASLNLPDSPRNIYLSGSYAYVSTTDNSQEMVIVNISNPAAPVVAGSFNATGTADGQGIYVVGTTVYLTRSTSANDEFLIINAAVPGSPTLVGSLDLGDSGNEVVVLGSNAYVASTSNSQELQVVNLTVPATPTLIGSYNLPGNSDALSISGFDNYVLLGLTGGPNQQIVFDVTTPATPTVSGSFIATAQVSDISLGENNRCDFLATSAVVREFQVIDITVVSNPASVGQYNYTDPLVGLAWHSGKNKVFSVSGLDTEEFIVISQ